MTAALVQFLLAAAVITAAGVWLARFADGIVESTGLGRLLTGSLFLAAATSMPEITVNFNAVSMHLPDITVGDLLGSSLLNLLILMAAGRFSACRKCRRHTRSARLWRPHSPLC